MKLKFPSLPKKVTASLPGAVDSALRSSESVTKRMIRFLNGSINIRLLNHPAIRWGLLAVGILYVVLGLVVGWKVYKVKAESVNIRRILVIYPFPAALMPQDVILVRDYLDQLKFIRHFAEKTKQALPPDVELRAQLINQMIETRLLMRTVKHYGVRVSKSDIDGAYTKIADENGGKEELSKLLTDLYGMNETEFRQLVRDQLLREKVKRELLVQIQVKHILIKDEKKAKEVLETLKKEPNRFDELAKQHSEDVASRDKNGDLGYVARGVMVPEFDDAAFKLRKDEITQDLVKTDFGFHIIKLTDRRGTLDKTYPDFAKDLRKDKRIWTVLK